MGYITRIAPSPTGDFHLGTARTAYFCWLAARATNGKFILRIDDTDDARDKPEFTKIIYDTMTWLGLDWDSTFCQSSKLDRYQSISRNLVAEGLAREIEGGAIALNFDPTMPRSWRDEIAGDISITERDVEKDLQNLILLRSDGKPTYHLATVVDDIDTEVNWIIRGHDHISNTSKHVAIYHALRKPIPRYSHVSLIFMKNKKLSKRDGAASALSYRNEGYDPEALLNFLLRFGWAPHDDANKAANIWPKEKAIKGFLTEGSMKNQAANLDINKLVWLNKLYKSGNYKRFL